MLESLGFDSNKKPPPKPDPYEYKELGDKRHFMRLLNLFSSSPENPQIECELQEVSMDPDIIKETNSDYEALSWCWGTAKPSAYINIRQGRQMYSKAVQPELVAALKALRHPQQDRFLWIDAVCINQENVGEKNHQVEMMSTIYGNAKSV